MWKIQNGKYVIITCFPGINLYCKQFQISLITWQRSCHFIGDSQNMSTIVYMRHFCTCVTCVWQLVWSWNETCYTCMLSGHVWTMHMYRCAKKHVQVKRSTILHNRLMSGESASLLPFLLQNSPDFGSPGTDRSQTSHSLRRFLMAAVHRSLLLVRISLLRPPRDSARHWFSTCTGTLLWTIWWQRDSATNVVDKSRGSMEWLQTSSPTWRYVIALKCLCA